MGGTPRYDGFTPSSARASKAARGSSRKTSTKPEVILRQALWRKGFRYRKNMAGLPGKPDIVFRKARVVVFVDGDFWHGRNWEEREKRLRTVANSAYWMAKIRYNMDRDHRINEELRSTGWRVLRFWETDVRKDTGAVVARIEKLLQEGGEMGSILAWWHEHG
jgi:DNA mismatch endonuclease (patch repair protein)